MSFNDICKPIPTYALSDQIGLDTETAYILDLETEEKYKTANELINHLLFMIMQQMMEEFYQKKLLIVMILL